MTEAQQNLPLGPPIHVAIPRIIGDLPSIGKDSQMTEGPRYSYRGIDDIMPHLKQLFARHGVHVTPVFDVLVDELGQARSGNPQRRVVVKGMFRFSANDGSFTAAQTIGEALDTGDKAFNKAMTAAFKYAVIQTFAIAGADDPDDHQVELGGGSAASRADEIRDAAVRYPNYDALKALAPALTEAGLADAVKVYAEHEGIDLRPGRDEPRLLVVLSKATELLAGATTAPPVEGPDPLVAQAQADLAAAMERRAAEAADVAESIPDDLPDGVDPADTDAAAAALAAAFGADAAPDAEAEGGAD